MSYSSTVLSHSPNRYYKLQDDLTDSSGNGAAAIVLGASTAWS